MKRHDWLMWVALIGAVALFAAYCIALAIEGVR